MCHTSFMNTAGFHPTTSTILRYLGIETPQLGWQGADSCDLPPQASRVRPVNNVSDLLRPEPIGRRPAARCSRRMKHAHTRKHEGGLVFVRWCSMYRGGKRRGAADALYRAEQVTCFSSLPLSATNVDEGSLTRAPQPAHQRRHDVDVRTYTGFCCSPRVSQLVFSLPTWS